MGKFVSKLVFMPPSRVHLQDTENDLFLETDHHSLIQVKIINNKHKLNLLISHGNAEDVNSVYEWANSTLSHWVNVNIIMYEFTGYGMNQESMPCSEQYCYNDIEAVYKCLVNQMGIDPKTIIVYGRSLGSGPSCYLAEKYPVGGLILNCGFMSVLRVIFKFRFTMPGDMFPNIDRMKNINCPVCIFHSIKDEIVPFYHGKELYEAAPNKFEPLFIDGTTHNNIDKISDDVFKHMEKFFKYLDSDYKEVAQNDNSII